MKKAAVFDLFETLITEWGHEKYTKRQMCADLGCSYEAFSPAGKRCTKDSTADRSLLRTVSAPCAAS